MQMWTLKATSFMVLLFAFQIGRCQDYGLNGQNSQTQNITVTEGNSVAEQMNQGTYNNGDGTITVVEVGGTGFVSLKKLGQRADTKMAQYAKQQNCSFKYMRETTRKSTIGVFPKVARTYQVLNKDGSPFITKDVALRKIKELKGLLDSDIITQEEFDESSKKYKNVLLGD